ncbi:ABC transporter permease [Candidatus Peregrinibacteria bacterium]|nr:MAG: ABC transporter permease [Candidatus Peregrinibacteria bacterium]
MKKIYILWLREIKRYLRSKSRMVGSLAQPLLYLLALGYGFGSVFQQAGEGNYLNFLAPGIIGMSIIFTGIFSGVAVIWDRQFGFLREMVVARTSRLKLMMGRTLGGATIATLQGVLVLALSILFGFRPESWLGILPSILIMFLLALLFTSLGIMIASLLEDMQGFQLIMNFLVMPLFFFSGALYPLEGLPKVLDIIAKINPLSYGNDALRGVLIENSHYGLGLDLAVLAGFSLIFLALGTHF